MLVHSVDPLAMFAKQVAEEKFILGDIKGAIFCATLAKTLDSDVDGIDETLVAYKIHRAAYKERGNNGTSNWWYAVLGIREGFEDIESIRNQYIKLVEMVNLKKNASVATFDAVRLITKAWSNIRDTNKREIALSNQQVPESYLGHVDIRQKKRSSDTKVKTIKCPRCGKWCKYEVPKDSNSCKHRDNCRAKNVLLIMCSGMFGCRFKFDPTIKA